MEGYRLLGGILVGGSVGDRDLKNSLFKKYGGSCQIDVKKMWASVKQHRIGRAPVKRTETSNSDLLTMYV